ncbi:MAG TPA: hypothetical protein P5125_02130 [Kiritimatiellia bacterium]|nr:hypothetical protein [Kiritimatiellia bacterium]HPC49508.1 hypothetical protein [Kiritimatiellia bacterium]HRU19131.1 hypothetical protein [Kiritimatiellia bacterium]
MTAWRTFPLAAMASALLFAGCATQRELIEKRIGQKHAFFETLPPETQQRLREGVLMAGDSEDAVWILYGSPDRVFQKVTGTTTNNIWSYVSYDAVPVETARPILYPVRTARGRVIWRRETFWSPDLFHHPYEYRRIEFRNGRVLSIEAEQQP